MLPEEGKEKVPKLKGKVLGRTFFSNATLREFVTSHVIKKDTRIAQDALDRLNQIMDVLGGWIIREAERMASSEGKSTISLEHVRSAVRLYLGLEEE